MKSGKNSIQAQKMIYYFVPFALRFIFFPRFLRFCVVSILRLISFHLAQGTDGAVKKLNLLRSFGCLSTIWTFVNY
jgi:hypothetical protein